MASFTLASKYTRPTYFRNSLLNPGTVYTDSQLSLSSEELANGIANGDITFTDGTSLVEYQGNFTVKRLCTLAAIFLGISPAVAAGVQAQLKLNSIYTVPVAVGPYLFQPGVIYQSTDFLMDRRFLLDALNKGVVQFADSTVLATFVADPTVANILTAFARNPVEPERV